MKIFSIKTLLGVGAIYGISQYAKKHGGLRNAFDGLLDKVKTAANEREQSMGSSRTSSEVGGDVGTSGIGSSVGTSGVGSSSIGENTGYGGTSGSYSGGTYSSGLGGNDGNRRR